MYLRAHISIRPQRCRGLFPEDGRENLLCEDEKVKLQTVAIILERDYP